MKTAGVGEHVYCSLSVPIKVVRNSSFLDEAIQFQFSSGNR
jgi:hypothetical protein